MQEGATPVVRGGPLHRYMKKKDRMKKDLYSGKATMLSWCRNAVPALVLGTYISKIFRGRTPGSPRSPEFHQSGSAKFVRHHYYLHS